MPLVNCKVELKLKWTKFCVLSAGGNDNLNDNDIDNKSNNIVFTITDTQLCSCSSSSAKNNQKLSNHFSIEFKKFSLIEWIQNKTNEFRYFLESNFVGVNRLLVLV